MLRLLAALVAAAALAFPATPSTATGQPTFPRDHFGHAGSSIEWWYFTALAKDASGTPYSVFFTLFASKGGLVPVSQVVNLATGAVVGHTEEVGLGKVAPSALDVKAGHARLRYTRRSDTWTFSVDTPAFGISLVQRATKPYVRHGGGTGVTQQSVAGPSRYYSATRMTATGTLRAGDQKLNLTGESWFDHQWGNYRDDPRAFDWDWFSCRFGDGTELMLYQFRDPATGRVTAVRNGTFVAKNGRATGVTSFDISPGPRTLDAAGRSWPLDWTLSVPSLSLAESVSAIVPDQLVRNAIVPTFWEGASTATGSRNGICFVELSYA